MAKIEKVSPMDNNSFDSIILSPNFLNSSDKVRFLTPSVKNFRRSFSPFISNSKTPNLSPIIKPKTPSSPSSSFLKRRDVKKVPKVVVPRTKHARLNQVNPALEMTMSVKAVLDDLALSEYLDIFEREEINLEVFFTITDDDLKSIGIMRKEHRQKILNFIDSFKTPKKSVGIAVKNILYRH